MINCTGAMEVNLLSRSLDRWIYLYIYLFRLLNTLRSSDSVLGRMTCSWMYHSNRVLYLCTLSSFADTTHSNESFLSLTWRCSQWDDFEGYAVPISIWHNMTLFFWSLLSILILSELPCSCYMKIWLCMFRVCLHSIVWCYVGIHKLAISGSETKNTGTIAEPLIKLIYQCEKQGTRHDAMKMHILILMSIIFWILLSNSVGVPSASGSAFWSKHFRLIQAGRTSGGLNICC